MSKVPSLSIFFMGAAAFAGFLIPIVLFIYFRKNKKTDISPFFVGCFIFIFFSMILETSVHKVVLGSSIGENIKNNIVLYAIYGGAMAAVFEECGRLFAFKVMLKKRRDKNINALMYGAGHGGFEAAAILGFTMISNLTLAAMVNNGRIESVSGSLSGAALSQLQTSITTLATTPSYIFLLGIAERISTVIIQISLSVLVWFSVKDKKSLFFAALLIHFVVDAITVIMTGTHIPAVIVEAVLAAVALAAALFARNIYRKEEN